jgi:hypothetical protein
VGRYDNPIPTRFLAPIACLKTPALVNAKNPDKLEAVAFIVEAIDDAVTSSSEDPEVSEELK